MGFWVNCEPVVRNQTLKEAAAPPKKPKPFSHGGCGPVGLCSEPTCANLEGTVMKGTYFVPSRTSQSGGKGRQVHSSQHLRCHALCKL